MKEGAEPNPLVEMSSAVSQETQEHDVHMSSRKSCSLGDDLKAALSMIDPRENKISVLLVFVPIGIIASGAGATGPVVFFMNFMAIIPLAWILGEATESIAAYTGQTLGGLLNATFGNAVEMILAVFALREGLVRVVQGSLLGSVLSNLLLVHPS